MDIFGSERGNASTFRTFIRDDVINFLLDRTPQGLIRQMSHELGEIYFELVGKAAPTWTRCALTHTHQLKMLRSVTSSEVDAHYASSPS